MSVNERIFFFIRVPGYRTRVYCEELLDNADLLALKKI
jgi:hypothetical protein